MKIGFLTDNYPSSGGSGGIGTYSKLVGEQLATLGHDVHVFTLASVPRHQMREVNGVKLWECPGWTKRREMPLLNALEYTVRFRANPWISAQFSLFTGVRRAARSGKFDVLESPEFGALGGLVAGAGLGRRLAVRLHTAIHNDGRASVDDKLPMNHVDVLSKRLANAADVITVPSEFARNSIADFWGASLDHAKVIANPVKLSENRSKDHGGDGSAIFWGRLEPRKGVDSIAAAVPLVRKQFPNFRVRFFGVDNDNWPGQERGSHIIKRLAGDAADACEVNPPLPHDRLIEEVRKASLVVLPSRVESFGLSFVEAMVWGMPCVVSNIPVFKELADEPVNALFADADNSADLAARICTLLGDPSMRENMAAANHLHARQWAVEKVVPQLVVAWLGKADPAPAAASENLAIAV